MTAKDTFEIPVGMRKVCRRFERWRAGPKARLPIPEALWSAAAERPGSTGCSARPRPCDWNTASSNE
jgi:hypothetical protein